MVGIEMGNVISISCVRESALSIEEGGRRVLQIFFKKIS